VQVRKENLWDEVCTPRLSIKAPKIYDATSHDPQIPMWHLEE